MRSKTIRASPLTAALLGQYGCRPTRVRVITIAEDQPMTADTQSLPAKDSEKLTKRRTPAKINRLNHKQMYRLNRWYESVHGDLPRGATREEVAREATKDLEFTVTAFNLDSTIEVTGLALPAALPDAPLHEVVRALAVLMRNQLKAGPEVPQHEIDEYLNVLNAYLAKR